MGFTTYAIFSALAASSSQLLASADTVSVTPHDSYSSSIGVLGCKINTDRVAYWPGAPDCDNFCIELSYGGRSVNILHIDSSGGAHDVSYDAWNYLVTGKGAREAPIAGGGVDMEYKVVDPSKCAPLLHTDGKMPLSASTSLNYLGPCLDNPSSWVAKNHVLYNIVDAVCHWGQNEVCTLNYPSENQPKCPSGQLGLIVDLPDQPVYDVKYPTGEVVIAATGEVVSPAPGAHKRTAWRFAA
ncbi:hypothetical protein F5Y17DRAFT_412589 [Xylariaceae sp. FL0594]|nr:hypothetical protein F5Y17DRAFT_412589 [Xylariaceae sp. FL0594]